MRTADPSTNALLDEVDNAALMEDLEKLANLLDHARTCVGGIERLLGQPGEVEMTTLTQLMGHVVIAEDHVQDALEQLQDLRQRFAKLVWELYGEKQKPEQPPPLRTTTTRKERDW